MSSESPLSAPPSRYQDGRYLADNPDWHAADAPWKAAQVLALLHERRLAPRSVGEVGCGSGALLERLSAALGAQVPCIGYDLSPQAITLAGPRQRDGLRFVCADLLALEPRPRHELLLAIDVIEHVEDCLGFLRRLRNHGERFVFHIPLELSAQMVLRGEPLLRARRLVGHLHHFSRATALATLEDAGYRIDHWRYTASGVDAPHRGWKSRLLELPRRGLHRLAPEFSVRLLGGYSLLVLAGHA